MTNAADGQSIQAQKRRRQQELADVETLLRTPEGRRFIGRLLRLSRVHQVSFTGNSNTFYYEGQRSLGLAVLQDVVAVDAAAYTELVQAEQLTEQGNG